MAEPKPEGLYLYCVARADRLPAINGRGIDDRPLLLQRLASVVAVISRVQLTGFAAEDAEARLSDVSWVGPRALRHQEVVERVMDRSPVLPVRFGTLFFSRRRVAELLGEHRREIDRYLDRVEDKREWSVKAFVDRRRVTENLATEAVGREAERLQGLSPGARYFEQRRLEQGARKQFETWLRGATAAIESRLEKWAVETRRLELLGREATGKATDMVLNRALLVPSSSADGLRDRIGALARERQGQGVSLELTGPWPPYSFCPSLAGGKGG